MNIKERLNSRGGYILDSEIQEMIEEFGENYEIVVKFYEHDRRFMSLKKLKELTSTNPTLEHDIREVFICANEYRRLFDKGGTINECTKVLS